MKMNEPSGDIILKGLTHAPQDLWIPGVTPGTDKGTNTSRTTFCLIIYKKWTSLSQQKFKSFLRIHKSLQNALLNKKSKIGWIMK